MMVSSEYRRMRAEQDLKRAWPQWKIRGLLGTGSYGEVYEISKEEYGITSYAALKILRIEEAQSTVVLTPGGNKPGMSESVIRNISNEINIMEQLKGAPGIVVIEDFTVLRDEGEVTFLIRMELLTAISRIFTEGGAVSETEVIKLGTDICKALRYCERRNIIHRDIKEGNLFRDRFGNYKLGDFGISRYMDYVRQSQTMTGTGTISYMAPEVYRGHAYNNTADLYSLGIVLYDLMNGLRLPFVPPIPYPVGEGDIVSANMRRINGEMLPPPAFASPKLASVLLKACDPDPARRYQTASEFGRALFCCAPEGTFTETVFDEANYRDAERKGAGPGYSASAKISGGASSGMETGANPTENANGSRKNSLLRSYRNDPRILTALVAALALVLVFCAVYSVAEYALPAMKMLRANQTGKTPENELPIEAGEAPPGEAEQETGALREEGIDDSAEAVSSAPDVIADPDEGEEHAGGNAAGVAVAPGKDFLPADQEAADAGNAEAESAEEAEEESAGENAAGQGNTEKGDPDVPVFEGYPHMAAHLSEIPDSLLADIESDLEEHLLARNVGDGEHGFHIRSYELVGMIFMGRRASVYDDGSESEFKNKLFPVYEVTALYDKSENGKTYSAEITNYYYRRYLNIELTGEGTADTDLSVSTDPKPSTVKLTSDDGKDTIDHIGYQGLPSIEEVQDFLYPRNEESYYIEYEAF